MSETYSAKRRKCPNFFGSHKKIIYDTDTKFRKLENYAEFLQQHFPDKVVHSSDYVCFNCYERIKKIVPKKIIYAIDSDNDANLAHTEDHDFRASTPERIEYLNETLISSSFGNISPLKRKRAVDDCSIERYVIRKKSELVSSFSSATSSKLSEAYNVSIDGSNDDFSQCFCNEWLNNLGVAFKNCCSINEKIRILTLIPSSVSKSKILSTFPEVTVYMIDKARMLVKTKGIYSKPDVYTGHPLDEKSTEIAMEYFLNDDFNCTRQSPNKSDVVIVKENGKKEKKVKRFLTRSLKEAYKLFKQEHPEIKMGITKFYTLRPKFVMLSPCKDVCLCIYCANFDLYVNSINNLMGGKYSDLDKVRSKLLSAIVCSNSSEQCFFQECTACPGSEGISLNLFGLETINEHEEIVFAMWQNGQLVKKTLTISNFISNLAILTVKTSVHIHIKNIQRKAIKEEKEMATSNSNHLVLHGDFAENWAVILSSPVQGNHWVNQQVSIFTGICYQGKVTKSFAVISDDTKHDSAHALLAMEKIIDLMKNDSTDSIEQISIVTDGAASHFKNRFQLHEMKNASSNKKWLFSATGHGKGAVDGVGGLVKHYATRHNLQNCHIESIQDANAFVKKVQSYTDAIKLILLPKEDVEVFRQSKIKEWLKASKLTGIQKTHVWKVEVGKKKKCYTARTAAHSFTKLVTKEKKKKKIIASKKNVRSKIKRINKKSKTHKKGKKNSSFS